MKPAKFKGVTEKEACEAARDQGVSREALIIISKGWLRGFRAGRKFEKKRQS